MKVKRLPNNDTDGVAMLTHVVRLENDEEDEENLFPDGFSAGTYAKDTLNRVWRLDEAATLLFGGLGLKNEAKKG